MIGVKKITTVALMSAILCLISPFSIPIGIVPISLASFGVYLASLILETLSAFEAVLIYVLIGALGVPVFSGMNGGIGVLLGPTGGFIFGYIFCALLSSYLSKRLTFKLNKEVPLALGTILLYAVGTAWFMFVTKKGLYYSLSVCVLPFLAGDVIKIIFASVLSKKLVNLK